MTSTASTRITSGQIAQLTQIAESAARKAVAKAIKKVNPTKEAAQLILMEHKESGSFRANVSSEVVKILISHLTGDGHWLHDILCSEVAQSSRKPTK